MAQETGPPAPAAAAAAVLLRPLLPLPPSPFSPSLRPPSPSPHPARESGWDIDLVCPVPDGSRPAAIQISAELGLPYREGLVKNRYVGRTFIMPDQRMREVSVRRKLNAMPVVFAGKNVLLIDDSIVRGTTMSQIVDMVRRAGAAKVRATAAALGGGARGASCV